MRRRALQRSGYSVVEDVAEIGDLLTETEEMGHSVCAVALTEADAVKAAARDTPDLTMVDVALGQGSGIVARDIDDAMLAAIASEDAKGRRLLVVTTNLDAQRAVIWDIGAIAASGGPKAYKLCRDVLAASASLPVIFAPQLIDVEADGHSFQEMHVDGGVGTPARTCFRLAASRLRRKKRQSAKPGRRPNRSNGCRARPYLLEDICHETRPQETIDFGTL